MSVIYVSGHGADSELASKTLATINMVGKEFVLVDYQLFNQKERFVISINEKRSITYWGSVFAFFGENSVSSLYWQEELKAEQGCCTACNETISLSKKSLNIPYVEGTVPADIICDRYLTVQGCREIKDMREAIGLMDPNNHDRFLESGVSLRLSYLCLDVMKSTETIKYNYMSMSMPDEIRKRKDYYIDDEVHVPCKNELFSDSDDDDEMQEHCDLPKPNMLMLTDRNYGVQEHSDSELSSDSGTKDLESNISDDFTSGEDDNTDKYSALESIRLQYADEHRERLSGYEIIEECQKMTRAIAFHQEEEQKRRAEQDEILRKYCKNFETGELYNIDENGEPYYDEGREHSENGISKREAIPVVMMTHGTNPAIVVMITPLVKKWWIH